MFSLTDDANGVSLSIYLCRATEFYKAWENTDVWYPAFHWPSAGVQFQLLQLSPLRLWTGDIHTGTGPVGNRG